MIVFTCSGCRPVITVGDVEPVEHIVKKLEGHLAICPSAVFRFTGTTELARKSFDNLQSVLVERNSKVRFH